MYLAVSEESISAVLLAERRKKQIPIYFIRRALKGAEMKYPKLEKLTLALILARLEKSGRIAKWEIELREHDIEFKGRNSIKGQILADFLAEIPSKESKEKETQHARNEELDPENTWKLYTDGTSSSDGSGAGLILVNPKGREYTYALRNEDRRSRHLRGFPTGSKLSERTLRSKTTSYKAILRENKRDTQSFKSYSMERVRRDQNKKADALSKLASMTLSKLAKEVLVEVLHEKSIVEKEMTDIIKKDGENWMEPIREYLLLGKLPNDRPRSVVSKITKLGYYWHSMHNDAKTVIQRCEACQIHSSIPRKPKQEMTSIMSAWPFPNEELTLWDHCQSHQEVVISDNGKQLAEGTFPVFCQKLGRTHQGWVDELPQVLWAHRKTPKSSNEETPFSLVYGSEVVVPIEISVETKRIKEFEARQNEKKCKKNLDILGERREIAAIK
ncbi:reverse transcriptase domain-containing protein [Tanacetum coccineum]